MVVDGSEVKVAEGPGSLPNLKMHKGEFRVSTMYLVLSTRTYAPKPQSGKLCADHPPRNLLSLHVLVPWLHGWRIATSDLDLGVIAVTPIA